ncbi:MAG: hypothetical protein K6G31_08880 [Paludibacteraceae bacterium]|nr:hypothetical protein [Paludibacteraceae bacterium]
MKLKLFIAPLLGAISVQAFAQDYGANKDECLQNLSLMGTYTKQAAKSGNYADAVAPWEYVYTNCPQSSQSIYIQGPNILKWQMKQATDVASKTKLFDKMMKVYDDRIKYFSNKKPSYYIRGRKAFDYVANMEQTTYKNTDPLKQNAYGWLKTSLDEGGADNELAVFQQFYVISKGIFDAKKTDTNIRQQYVNDYLMLTDLLGKRVSEGSEADSTYDQLKGAIDFDFGRSGAADCNQLNAVYAAQVDAHKADKDWLKNVLKLYDMADCDGSTVYFKASEYLYKIEPTYTAANGLAAMAYSKKDINGAIGYLNKACDLATSKSDKSNIMLKIANLYYKQKNYQQVRTYAQKALSYNSNNGSAYLLIGNAYAASASTISTDAFIQRTAYWAAVDKFEKAKAVDSNCTGIASSLISSYKKYFPDKKECFMRKISGTFHVPGWINENTTVR